jgi:hypothetical protein
MDPDRRNEEYGWHMEDARPDHGGASGDAESRSPISGIAGCRPAEQRDELATFHA